MTRLLQVLRYACALLVACGAVFGQGLTPTTPAKEYVRIGDRIIATENAGVLLISNVTATSISSTGATITWTTTIGGTSQVDYGTTASYGTSTTLDPTMVTTHSQPVTGLVVNTLYHYRVRSIDNYNNAVTSGDFTFTTTNVPVISNVAAGPIANTSATITWTTNVNADSLVEYGLTNAYGSATTLNPNLVTSHSQGVSGLTGATTYHYRVKSKDASGNLATSGDFTFTTSPNITNVNAAPINSNGATINWTTDEQADSLVEYGLTASYGSSTTLDSTPRTTHQVILGPPMTAALSPNTLYHYRVKSKDSAGYLATSGDFTFTTAAAVVVSISGQVTVSGFGQPNIHILLNGADIGVYTDSNGNYTFANLNAGSNYTVAPTSASLLFTPGSATFAPLNASQSGVNFTGVPGPTTTTVNPSNGNLAAEQFLFQTAAPNGLFDISNFQILWSTSSSTTANQCYINSYSPTSGMSLADDAGTGIVQPGPLNVYSTNHITHTINFNSQCIVDYWETYYQYYTPTFSLFTNMYFFRSFAGSKQLWIRKNSDAWLQVGNWTVPTPPDPSLTITYPTAGITVTGNITITGAVSDANSPIASVVVYVDGVMQGNATVNGSTYSFTMNATSSVATQHTIQVIATDSDSPIAFKSLAKVTVTFH